VTDDQHGDPHGDQHAGGTPPGGSRWDPLPQGDYDDGATAFVKLPEGGVDALLASSESPLAAPGHGYVPPQITVTPATTAGTDPAATGSWTMPSAPSAPVDGTQWQTPDAGQDPAAHQGYGDYAAQQDPYGGAAPYGGHAGPGVPGHDDRFAYPPGATGQWDFSHGAQADTDAAAARPAPGQDVTGQWSIPVADGDLPDESGEFTTSSLAEQWGTGAPATLPGGAPAPWATQPPGQPWGESPAQDRPAEDRGTPSAQPWGESPAQDRPAEDPGTPSARPAAQPWGEATAPTGPAEEERPAAGTHGPGPAASGHGYDSGGAGHGHGPDAAVGEHGPGVAAGPHESDATTSAHGPGYDTAAAGHEHGHGPGAGLGADHGPDSAAVDGHGPDAAAGPHEPDEPAPGYGSTAGGHGHGHRPDAAAAAAPHEPDATASASAHEPGPVASPDGSRPADGPYDQAPDAAADPGVPADDESAGPATGSGTVTDGPRGAEEAPEGPTGPSPDPAEEARAESHPEVAEGPLAGRGREPAAGGEPMPEPAQEHGPGDDAVDAADARTGADGDGADAGATEAGPDGAQEAAAPAGPQDEHPLASYVLRVNGADRPVTDAWIGESLLYVLRERLGLAGAKDGCSQGECGACNVQVDGRLVASCLVPSVTAAGSEVRTVEGLATDGQPSDVQRALARRGAVQCGFCVPGMAMTVHNLLEGNPAPTELEARQALCGNLCRCSGYRGVLEAVQEVVAEREAHADADAQAGADTEEPRIPHQAGPGAGGVNPAAFESQPPPGAQDLAGPHDRPPYGDHGDHGTHGRDGGHA
jgi:aerobic-type carbon monoxide dehydrogenase small subunit (CoxS/CutS family)